MNNKNFAPKDREKCRKKDKERREKKNKINTVGCMCMGILNSNE